MKRQITTMILIAAVLIAMPFQAYAATPKETVEAGVNNLPKTLGDPSFKAKPKDERIAIIDKEIETVFDFKELSRRPLGREWKKMNPEQQKICSAVQGTSLGCLCGSPAGLLGSKNYL